MSNVTVAAGTAVKPLLLTPARAARLAAYAHIRGLSEDEVVSEALDLLWQATESRDEEYLPELAAPAGWEVEIPVVLDIRPKAVFQVEARVVRCRRGIFPDIGVEVLFDPDGFAAEV